MRILHLTDFHYSNNHKEQLDQNNIVSALINDLKKDEPIDFLFFTGDLVFSGNRPEDFEEAKITLLDTMCKHLPIKKSNIFICCGNHDVHRNQELQDTADTIGRIKSNVELEQFLTRQEGKSFEESLKNVANYKSFENLFYNEYSPDRIHVSSDLFSIHYTQSRDIKIGILAINSSWRSVDSKSDRGNLLFPVSILKEAVEEIKQNSEFKIILMHHPISDFKDWNCNSLEDIIHEEFHLLFSGHLHKKKQSIQICTDEGIFCCSSPATLTKQGGTIGYSILDIDIETYDIEIINRLYNQQDNCFYHQKENIQTSIPVGKEKKALNDFKRTLRKKYFEENQKANDLFISFDKDDGNTGFDQLFTTPILKTKSKAELAKIHSDSPIIELETILESSANNLIIGKDKSGKTSILVRILLDLLKDFTVYKCLPLYIDSKEYRKSSKRLDVYKLISSYYELNRKDAEELSEKYTVRILIDNYDPSCSWFNEVINEFLVTHEASCFTVVTEEKIADSFSSYEFDGRSYENLFIHEISRPEVRSLASKWPNLSVEKRELVLDKIFGIFSQLNIPKNYWTVSLFLWIFEKNQDANFHNSFELIQLYIDNLLDRKQLALDKSSKLKFDEYKAYLSELAHFLMFERSDKFYTAEYSEIVEFTSKYRERNRRFVIEVRDIIELIIQKGIIKKIFEDSYTFRLNGVFEYFIALYMTKDKVFTDGIINDDHYYLSFKNELELYAGFEKDNEDFLKTILVRTKSIFKNLNYKYQNVNIDNQLLLKISEVFDITIPIKSLSEDFQKTLPVETQDQLLDDLGTQELQNSEVKVKEYYDMIDDNSDNLEKALFILSRVFRNSNIHNHNLVNQTLDYILESACQLGFKLIDEAEEDPHMLSIVENEKLIVQLLTNFMPLIVQSFLYDAVAQNDLERIFKDKIEELKKREKDNQFKLLLLYFMLIDLDINSNKKLIEEVINTITITILRQTALLKLYYYLMFKCTNRPHLEKYLKEKIREQTLKIDSSSNVDRVQKNISKTSRIARLNKRK